jgi:hypothetical protein
MLDSGECRVFRGEEYVESFKSVDAALRELPNKMEDLDSIAIFTQKEKAGFFDGEFS